MTRTETAITSTIATFAGTKRKSKAPCASDEERKERRRAANRRSAQKSRYREMVLMDELQKTVSNLSKRNATLKEENDAFRRDLAVLQNLMKEKKLRGTGDVKPTSTYCQANSCTSNNDSVNTSIVGFSLLDALPQNTVERTPSPVESLNLNPDKIFPIDHHNAEEYAQPNATTLTAENLFRAIMVAGSGSSDNF